MHRRIKMFVILIIVVFPLTLLTDIPSIATGVIACGVVLAVFWGWPLFRQSRELRILEEDLDPERYLKALERYPHSYVQRLNRAAALLSLNRCWEAGEILLSYELPPNAAISIHFVYHSSLMKYYIQTSAFDQARAEYDYEKTHFNAGNGSPALMFNMGFLDITLQFKMNPTPDTAKSCLEQLRLLNDSYEKKPSKRHWVSVSFLEAELLEGVGDQNAARAKYKLVAENGNKLYIAEIARRKFSEASHV